MEALALKYGALSDGESNIISLALVLFGAFACGFAYQTNATLSRVSYFVYFSAILLASNFLGLFSVHLMRNALVGGYFWVIVCIQFFSVIIIGFLICAISKKRSRDAYGVAKYAYLPFIPLGFLWLLFMPPKNRTISGIKSTPFMRGWGGVFTGVSLLIASGVAANSTKEAVQRFAQQVSQDPALDQAGFEMRIYSRGIDAILTELASGFQTPHRVDNETVLKSVVADGSTLRYTYETAAAIAALPAPYKTDLKRRNCVAPLMPVINAGATMEHVYTRPDGSLIDRLRFDTRTCN